MIFLVVLLLHFRFALHVVWSSPPRPEPQNPSPPPSEAGWTTVSCWCTGSSLYLNVPSSTHLKTPRPPQPVSHVFCTAVCVCHVHVDTSSLLLSPLLTSALILSTIWIYFLLLLHLVFLLQKNRNMIDPPLQKKKKMSSCYWVTDICICEQMLDWVFLSPALRIQKVTRDGIHLVKWIIYFLAFRAEPRTLAKVSSS